MIFAALVSPAQANRIHNALQQQVVKNRLPADSPGHLVQQLVRRALGQAVNRPLRTLTWEQFQQENAEISRYITTNSDKEADLVNDLYNLDCNLLLKTIDSKEKKTGHPDYAKETKGVKYIYLGEHHYTHAIPTEVEYFLATLREANPTARILLATEFAIREKQENSPLLFADPDIPAKFETGDFQLPFYWNISSDLFSTAIKLKMDILALDDMLTYPGPEIRIKLGNALVTADPNSPQVTQILQQYHRIIPDETVREILSDFLARTDWGIEQRNRQWALYLQTVSPFYDIIVTYAGEGHLSTPFDSLPYLVGDSHYVHFYFSTEERLPDNLETICQQCSLVQQEQDGKVTPSPVFFKEQVEFLEKCLSSQPAAAPYRTFYSKNRNPDYDESDLQELNRLSQYYFHTDWQTATTPNTYFAVSLPGNKASFPETRKDWEESLEQFHRRTEVMHDFHLKEQCKEILQAITQQFAQIIKNKELSPTEKAARLESLTEEFERSLHQMNYIFATDNWNNELGTYRDRIQDMKNPELRKQCEEILQTLKQQVAQIIQNEQLSFAEKEDRFRALETATRKPRHQLKEFLSQDEWERHVQSWEDSQKQQVEAMRQASQEWIDNVEQWNHILAEFRSYLPDIQNPDARKEYKELLESLEQRLSQIIQNGPGDLQTYRNQFFEFLKAADKASEKMLLILKNDGAIHRALQKKTTSLGQ